MKSFIILVSLAVAFASDFEMKIDEGGKEFSEKIKIDIDQKTEEVDVPAHGDRAAVDVLSDFNVGLSASKRVDLKTCFIEAISKDLESPVKMDISMRLAKAEFPKSRYAVVNQRSIKIGELNEAEVGEKIAAHCAGYKMIQVVGFVTSNLDHAVLEYIKAKQRSGKSKRDVVTTFTSCRNDSTNVLETCPPSRLATSCKFIRNDGNTCTYRITCNATPTGFDCIGQHRFSSMAYTPVNHLAYADSVDMIMYRVSCLQQEQFLVLSEQLRVFKSYWLQRPACA
eukprot:gene1433-15858_t